MRNPDTAAGGGMPRLNLAHSGIVVDANGPGRRFSVWVQGCGKDCGGCFNPELRARRPREVLTPEALARRAVAAGPLDGVTLSGGEPFDQGAALVHFVDALRGTRSGPGDVLAFSGYTVEELSRPGHPGHPLLARVDLLVDGPYRREQAARGGLRGSANQRLLPLTAAGRRLLRRIEGQAGQAFGVTVGAAGEVLFTGFPPADVVEALRRYLTGTADAGCRGAACSR